MSLMLKEILEQPHALRATFRAERAHALEFMKFARQKGFRLVVLVARGTSDNAARFGRYLTEITTGIPASLAAPSVHTLYRTKLDYRHALVVGISQSGEGTDINMVLEAAKRQGGYTIGITNEKNSAMAKLVDEVFLVHAGRQHSVAATKTYTGQLMIFYLLAAALGTSHQHGERQRDSRPRQGNAEADSRTARTGGAIPLHESLRGGGARHQLRQCV